MTHRPATSSTPLWLLRPLAAGLCILLLGACTVGPDYQKPGFTTTAQFKAAPGWRQASPSDALARGAWWEIYQDAQLNQLVERLNGSNQTVAQYEAQYRQAQALVRSSRASLFPTLDLTTGKTRSAQGTGSSSSSLSSSNSGIRDTYNAQLGVSWRPTCGASCAVVSRPTAPAPRPARPTWRPCA